MGGAFSSNVANQYLNAVTKIATNVLNNQKISSLQAQGIIVKDAKSDVIISGNHFNQSVSINLSALLKSISTQSAQQDLMQQLNQLADSTNKQLNLFQYSDANNTMNNYLSATIDLTNNIQQNCASLAKQDQTILVDTTGGKVTVTNNTFNQTGSLLSSCMMDSTSSSDAIQKAQQQADQSAKATNVGVNIWALVVGAILGLLCLLLPELIPLIGLEFAVVNVIKIVLSMFFVLVLLTGVVLIAMFFSKKKSIISLNGDVSPISGISECGAVVVAKSDEYKNPEDAGNACLDNKYAAFDFNLDTQHTEFYSKVSDRCENVLINEQSTAQPRVVPKINPILFETLPDPTLSTYKDVILTTDGNMYYCNQNEKNENVWSAVQDAAGNPIQYFNIPGIKSKELKIIYTEPVSWPSIDYKVLIQVSSIRDPAITEYNVYIDPTNVKNYSSKPPPPTFNYEVNKNQKITMWSGFKREVNSLSRTYLWISIIMIIIGFVGVLIQIMKMSGSRKKPANKNQIQMTKRVTTTL